MRIFILSLAFFLVALPALAGNRLTISNISNTIINQVSSYSHSVIYNISQGLDVNEITQRFARDFIYRR